MQVVMESKYYFNGGKVIFDDLHCLAHRRFIQLCYHTTGIHDDKKENSEFIFVDEKLLSLNICRYEETVKCLTLHGRTKRKSRHLPFFIFLFFFLFFFFFFLMK